MGQRSLPHMAIVSGSLASARGVRCTNTPPMEAPTSRAEMNLESGLVSENRLLEGD